VDQGILNCTNPQCMMEFPVIDGIPIIVPDVRTYVAYNVLPLLKRDDLYKSIESIIGDCTGPGSPFNLNRQHLSSYGFDHYGDFDPEEPVNPAMPPGTVLNTIKKANKLYNGRPKGIIIDMGCSVGRTTFELSEKYDQPVIGVDLNFGMLKSAAKILTQGLFAYPKRRTGVVFENKCFGVDFKKKQNIDFWACDAMNLPFRDRTFSFAFSFNLLDCVSDPLMLLMETGRIMKKSSHVILTSPYDWSENATSFEGWIGGHSQRSEQNGDPEKIFKTLFSSKTKNILCEHLKIINEASNIPWSVRLHDRSCAHYYLHMTELEKI